MIDKMENLTESLKAKIDKSAWKVWKFSDLVENINEKIVPKDSGLERYIGLEHLDSGSLHIRRFGETSSLVGDKLKIYKGDLIFAKRNAYLKRVAIAEFDAVASAHSLVLRAKPKNVLPEFLPFLMLSETFWRRAIEISVGSLSPTINWTALAKQEFLLPPKDQQAELAELLWNAVVYVDNLKVSYEKLIKLKCSILDDIFTINKFNSDSKIADIEKSSFKKIEFGKICDESMFGPRFSSDLYDQNGNIASLRTTDLSDEGEINLSSMPKAIIHTDKFKDHFMQPGDLVISRSGTCGVAAVFEGFEIPVIPAAFLIRFRLKKNINPHYVKLFFNSSIGREMTSRIASGAVQKNLTSKGILALEIPLPDLNVQEQVVKLIEHLNIELFRNHIVSSNNFRMNLINQVF